MDIMLLLFGFAGIVAIIALTAFFWTVRSGQYDDPEGNAARILFDEDKANN